MAKILFATVPLSGHVNPGIPLVRGLVARGHEVIWYCGSSFRETIIKSGAAFVPFTYAPEFNDHTVANLHGPVPTRSLMANASFYIRHVFYRPMPEYYEDLKKILLDFDADVIVSDEWFCGGIPFAELGIKPWVIFGNSPVMMVSKNMPMPGSGLMPDHSIYGRNRDMIVKLIASRLFFPLQRHINKIRKACGLPKLQHYFFEHNTLTADLCLKFNTPAFEFPYADLPSSIRFVGPVLPENGDHLEFSWMEPLRKCTRPVIFITQGSVDVYDIRKLIIPALNALRGENLLILVSTGGKSSKEIAKAFPDPNIIVEPYIPYALIMPYLSLMITNGGFGGVSTALAFGVPLIVAGNSEDKPEVASRVVFSGAGIDLKTGKPTSRAIRKAVFNVLNQKRYREAASRIRDDYAKHHAVNESVALIEALIKTR